MKILLFLPFLLASQVPQAAAAAATDDILMGSVVKSDKWTMDRKKNLEYFDGAVSFKNPHYIMRSEHAIYDHAKKLWNIYGSAYILRKSTDSSSVEINCERGKYFEAEQLAFLERGSRQIRMKYNFPDSAAPEGAPREGQRQAGAAKELHGLVDKAKAEGVTGLMSFEGDFSLATENLYMLAQKGLYRDSEKSFLMYESTPVAVGTREGYDFAVTAEKLKFFRDSRDIKFYNNVSGWIKDVPSRVAKVKK
ncbi:MAG: hypothetical protein NTX59_11740 [Elusimicrobia bacterium]|nr:hypothetical protein [Elusimicrobiota bacterium]